MKLPLFRKNMADYQHFIWFKLLTIFPFWRKNVDTYSYQLHREPIGNCGNLSHALHRLFMISNFYLSPKPTFICLFSKLGSLAPRAELELPEHYDLCSLCVMTATCYFMSYILWVTCLVRRLTRHCSFMVNCLPWG